MEATKRTYQKHKTEKKITVKYDLIPKNIIPKHIYINFQKNAQEEIEMPILESSIYVQVTYNRKSTKFRCKIRECYLDNLPNIPLFESIVDFEIYYPTERDDLVRELTRDSNYIKWIVEQEIKMNPKFNISELPEIYNSQKYNLISCVEHCLINHLLTEIEKRILGAIENGANSSKYIIRYVNHNVSALQNLEQFISLYPDLELSNIKNEFYPQLWHLNYHLEESALKCRIQMKIQGYEKYRYNIEVLTSVTIFDYTTNIAKYFFLLNPHITHEKLESIFNDLKKLLNENFYYYFKSFDDSIRRIKFITYSND